jgi:hypothetical protein
MLIHVNSKGFSIMVIRFLQLTILGATVALLGCAAQPTLEPVLQAQSEHKNQLEAQHTLLVAQQGAITKLQAQQEGLATLVLQTQEQLERVREGNQQIQKTLVARPANTRAPVAAATAPQKPVLAAKDLAPSKMVFGFVEWLWVDKLQDKIKARIDTGAKSSSLHATDIRLFERDGKQWVRFKLHTHRGSRVAAGVEADPIFELPVHRMVKIKQASATENQRRPVVKLRVKLGNYTDDAEFSLTDRGDMLYPALLGRSFLRDVAVVDVSESFIFTRDDKTGQSQ